METFLSNMELKHTTFLPFYKVFSLTAEWQKTTIYPPGANFFGCGSRFPGNFPEISRELGCASRKFPGKSPGNSPVNPREMNAFPWKRISREIIHRLSPRRSSPGKAYFEALGVPGETHLPGHLQNNVISSILPGKGASPVPVSAELPTQ